MCMLVDSCSSELICVWVYQYVIPNLFLSQYLSLSLPFLFLLCLPFLTKKDRWEGIQSKKAVARRALLKTTVASFKLIGEQVQGKVGEGQTAGAAAARGGSPHQAWPQVQPRKSMSTGAEQSMGPQGQGPLQNWPLLF